jgi:Ulp1 family protease
MNEWSTYEPGYSIPQQDNIYDCGVFMCQFAESISSGNSVQYVTQSDMPYYRKRMLLEILKNNKRFDEV